MENVQQKKKNQFQEIHVWQKSLADKISKSSKSPC
jgi:hypothetical protein